jgi:hypothetical protein
MMRQLIEKEVTVAKHAVGSLRGWLHHRTQVMKEHAFDRPLDDLGQTIDDVEHRADPVQQPGPPGAPHA